MDDETRYKELRKEIHKAAHGNQKSKRRIKHPNAQFWIWDLRKHRKH
jgi:hypothetical protein